MMYVPPFLFVVGLYGLAVGTWFTARIWRTCLWAGKWRSTVALLPLTWPNTPRADRFVFKLGAALWTAGAALVAFVWWQQ